MVAKALNLKPDSMTPVYEALERRAARFRKFAPTFSERPAKGLERTQPLYPSPFEPVWVGDRWVDAPILPSGPGIPSTYAYREWLDSVEDK